MGLFGELVSGVLGAALEKQGNLVDDYEKKVDRAERSGHADPEKIANARRKIAEADRNANRMADFKDMVDENNRC